MRTRDVLHHNDASTHTSVFAMITIHNSGSEHVPHSPCLPDFAPSVVHVFPKMKKALAGGHFNSDCDVIDAVGTYL